MGRQRLLAILLGLMDPTMSVVGEIKVSMLSFEQTRSRGVILTVQDCRTVKRPCCNKGRDMAALECGFVHACIDAGLLVSGYGNDRYADPCKSDGPITYQKGA